MLLPFFQSEYIEAGCDEAGRGCLAGPVFAAAVILPKDYSNKTLNDSKQIAEQTRYALREIIEKDAIAFAVAQIGAEEIDHINILNASIKAMHLSLDQLKKKFQFIIVDGNKFKPYKNIPHQTIVKGDGKYLSIAAASILAKTYRDDFMTAAHNNYPQYDWINNKGYGTLKHRQAMMAQGTSPLHRKSFHLKEQQLKFF
ncbi:MAG: ribonuclease HII [Chitinophagales bacterium]|jgi:ribonuclease HII|nr:ribonuclease HII [Chitinophagales bacterium]